MIAYFKEIFSGAWSLLVGMKLTAGFGLGRTMTVHYPYERLDVSPNFRGHTELAIDPDTADSKCISCGMCEKACPSNCITVHSEKPEGSKKKVLVEYFLDFTKCSLCGNCVEVCPTDAIEYSQEYNLAGTSRHDFHFELVGRMKNRIAALGITPKPKVEAAPASEPA